MKVNSFHPFLFSEAMVRKISDGEGIIWSCVQAYAGLEKKSEESVEAAPVEAESDKVYVVCTPSGKEQSVRLELETDWENALSDEDLLQEIKR